MFKNQYLNNMDTYSDESHAMQDVKVVDDFSSIQHSDDAEEKKEKFFGHIKPNKKAKIDL